MTGKPVGWLDLAFGFGTIHTYASAGPKVLLDHRPWQDAIVMHELATRERLE